MASQETRKKVDSLIDKLLAKYEAEGSNIDRRPAPFLQECLRLKEIAPFLDIDSYMHFLGEMSTLVLELTDGSYVTCYGVDDWDDGMNIFGYPIPDENGFHMFMDICNPEGEILYFAYNSNEPGRDVVWIARDNEGEIGVYEKTDMDFVGVLELIETQQIQVLNKERHRDDSDAALG